MMLTNREKSDRALARDPGYPPGVRPRDIDHPPVENDEKEDDDDTR